MSLNDTPSQSYGTSLAYLSDGELM